VSGTHGGGRQIVSGVMGPAAPDVAVVRIRAASVLPVVDLGLNADLLSLLVR
jgi:hypothetical protein